MIGALISNLSKINQESDGSLIAVRRLWVTGDNGDILLSYLYDLELGKQRWGMAPGVTRERVSFVSLVYFVVGGLSRLNIPARLIDPFQDLRRFYQPGNMHRAIPIHNGRDQLVA